MMRFDIHKAFDSVCHKVLVQVLERMGVPSRIIHAMLRELCDCLLHVSVGRHSGSKGLRLYHGTKQGGRDTPRHWKIFLWGVVCDLVMDWERRDLVWRAGDTTLNLKLWADDGLLFARSKADLELKFEELTMVLFNASLRFKADSLCWISTMHLHDDEPFVVPPGSPMVPRVHSLIVLGSCIDDSNSPDAAIANRVKAANAHWQDRKQQLCQRRTPFRARVQRWFSTVGKTLLFGVGELNLRIEHIHKFDSVCLLHLRTMLGRKRDPAKESPWAFAHRLNVRVRSLLSKWNMALPGAVAWSLHHSWAGHAVRSRGTAYHLLCFRDALWEQQQQLLPPSGRVRRRRAGRPIAFETKLVACHGPRWKDACFDRQLWKQMGKSFVAEQHWFFDHTRTHDTESGVSGHAYFSRFVTMIHEVHRDSALEPFPNCAGLRLLVCGDSRITLDAARGQARTSLPALSQLWRKLQQLHFMLSYHFGVTCPSPDSGFHWVPRSENPLADSLATAAIKTRGSAEEFDHSRRWSNGDHLVIYFDGGSREIQDETRGGAGFAICLFSDSGVHLLHTGSYFLGCSTNNEAEASALWLALLTVVRYLYSCA